MESCPSTLGAFVDAMMPLCTGTAYRLLTKGELYQALPPIVKGFLLQFTEAASAEVDKEVEGEDEEEGKKKQTKKARVGKVEGVPRGKMEESAGVSGAAGGGKATPLEELLKWWPSALGEKLQELGILDDSFERTSAEPLLKAVYDGLIEDAD